MDKTFNKTTKKDLFNIDPRNITVEEGFNSRVNFCLDDLIVSIKKYGVKNPISVIKYTNENNEEKYRLVDGERRYRATMKAIEDGCDIKYIPAIFLSSKLSKEELLIEQLVRNEGKQFNEYEYALACQKFKNWGYTNNEISEKINKNIGMVSYFLDHLHRDKRVQDLLKEDRISGSEVRRIYASHKNKETNEIDEASAVREILKAKKFIDDSDNPKVKDKKITIGVLKKLGSTTIVKKETDEIRKGLNLLFKYVADYKKQGHSPNMSVKIITDTLNANPNMDIFEAFNVASGNQPVKNAE